MFNFKKKKTIGSIIEVFSSAAEDLRCIEVESLKKSIEYGEEICSLKEKSNNEVLKSLKASQIADNIEALVSNE